MKTPHSSRDELIFGLGNYIAALGWDLELDPTQPGALRAFRLRPRDYSSEDVTQDLGVLLRAANHSRLHEWRHAANMLIIYYTRGVGERGRIARGEPREASHVS